MAEITVLKCDHCGSMEGVKHYEVWSAEGGCGVDLCEKVGKALDDVFEYGKPLGKARTAPATRRRSGKTTPLTKITSIEDIEKAKHA